MSETPKNRQQRRAGLIKNTSKLDVSLSKHPINGGIKSQKIITRKNFTTRKV